MLLLLLQVLPLLLRLLRGPLLAPAPLELGVLLLLELPPLHEGPVPAACCTAPTTFPLALLIIWQIVSKSVLIHRY